MTTLAARIGDSVRDRYSRLRQAWAAMPAAERWVTVFLATMIVGGVVIRIQAVPWPNWFTFDEEPFVKNAHSYAPVSYTHLRAHETDSYLVCRLLLEKK